MKKHLVSTNRKILHGNGRKETFGKQFLSIRQIRGNINFLQVQVKDIFFLANFFEFKKVKNKIWE